VFGQSLNAGVANNHTLSMSQNTGHMTEEDVDYEITCEMAVAPGWSDVERRWQAISKPNVLRLERAGLTSRNGRFKSRYTHRKIVCPLCRLLFLMEHGGGCRETYKSFSVQYSYSYAIVAVQLQGRCRKGVHKRKNKACEPLFYHMGGLKRDVRQPRRSEILNE
jgi:hypothetical protein